MSYTLHLLKLQEALQHTFQACEIKVCDVSSQHQGHQGVQGAEGVTHLDVLMVSTQFQDCSRIQRHRQIYQAVHKLWGLPLHALRIQAFTPDEWAKKDDLSSIPAL